MALDAANVQKSRCELPVNTFHFSLQCFLTGCVTVFVDFTVKPKRKEFLQENRIMKN